jgi:hypothetical protein
MMIAIRLCHGMTTTMQVKPRTVRVQMLRRYTSGVHRFATVRCGWSYLRISGMNIDFCI